MSSNLTFEYNFTRYYFDEKRKNSFSVNLCNMFVSCVAELWEQIVASCGCLDTEATWKEFERGGGVVVAQLADRSLLTQEVRGSNRVTVQKCYAEHVFAVYF